MKVVGSGLIASAFANEYFGESCTIFASGVSNSKCENPAEFDREKRLLCGWLTDPALLLYFSTCSAYDPSFSKSPYVIHKFAMEKLVINSGHGLVFRLPQLVGRCNNPHTITNFIAEKVYLQQSFDLQSGAVRNLIDVVDVVNLTRYALDSSFDEKLVNFSMPHYISVLDITQCFEKLFGRKSRYKMIPSLPFRYPRSEFMALASSQKIVSADDDYPEKLLNKYYQDYKPILSALEFSKGDLCSQS